MRCGRQRIPLAARGAALLAAIGLLAAGCGDSSGEESVAARTDTETEQSGATEPAAERVKLYFTAGEQFNPVGRGLPLKPRSLRPAMEALLEGPTPSDAGGEEEVQTEIPGGVALKKLKVSPSGKAVVKLSPRFTAGISAVPAQRSRAQRLELDARLGQVIYTLDQFAKVDSARVVSGGVVVDRDLTRSEYAEPDRGPKPIRRAPGEPVAGTRRIQLRLAELGYLPRSAVDGLYGYRTEQAVTAFQAWQGIGRDGIVGPITRAELARARRPRPSARGPSRRIEVHLEEGVALLVRRGRTARAIHISTGAPGTPTPTGTYRVFRKELRSWSVPFSVWLPYASYFNNGIAFHEYPDVPPYPASHGCVRVPSPEAKLVYAFARIDTVVVVI